MKKGKLIILSAPSGAGKTTICKELLKNNDKWNFSVSATTRPKRENEVDGEDYIFMAREKFDHKEKIGEFIECEWVHGNKYGTLHEPLENDQAQSFNNKESIIKAFLPSAISDRR